MLRIQHTSHLIPHRPCEANIFTESARKRSLCLRRLAEAVGNRRDFFPRGLAELAREPAWACLSISEVVNVCIRFPQDP